MKEIKSVRVRRKFTTSNENFTGFSDHKVTLYDNGGNSFKVGVVQTGRKEEFAEYKKEGRFNNFSNDDFIGDGINVLISKQNNNEVFEIIQDPWLDIPPKRRNFGYDSYYLNNGSEVTINWTQNEKSVGGVKWSNDDGMELLVSKGGESKSTIIKTVTIFAPDSYQGENKTLKITRLGIEYLFTDTKDYEYSGLVLDKEILNDVISRWNSKVPNYTLSLCDPDYIKCEIIPYISPVDELENIDKKLETPEETKSIKEKLNVIIPKDLQIKVRQDVSFKIFVGEPPKTEKPFVDGFDFGDGDDLSDLLLEDEFREVDFKGLDESQLEIQEYESEEVRIETQNQAQIINNEPYVPGKYVLDLIPGEFLGNNKMKVKCCQIDGKPVNIKIADAFLDMKAAAKKDGVNLFLTSGFRPDFGNNINTKSEKGVKVTAESQEVLYQKNCVNKGGKCNPDTAKPGNSKHGSGIAIDLNTGTRNEKLLAEGWKKLSPEVYKWLIKNSWRFGFVRTVKSEEWHFEYWREASKSGPYAKIAKSNQLFYADLGLNNLKIT